MGISVKINLDLTDVVTLRDLRKFLAQAERVGASDDQDLRDYDAEAALLGLHAIGTLDAEEDGQ